MAAASDEAQGGAPKEESYEDPGQEVDGAGSHFVNALANVLTHLASLAGRSLPQRVTRFHAIRAPQLSINDYLMRIAKYFQCSNECFVLCLVYIDRIVKLHPEFTISNLNIHRLLVTSIMLAVKFFDDVYYSNSYYARVGGVKTKEVNGLEAQFLQLIDWKLHVSPQEYDQYRNHVYVAVTGVAPPGAPPAPGGPPQIRMGGSTSYQGSSGEAPYPVPADGAAEYPNPGAGHGGYQQQALQQPPKAQPPMACQQQAEAAEQVEEDQKKMSDEDEDQKKMTDEDHNDEKDSKMNVG